MQMHVIRTCLFLGISWIISFVAGCTADTGSCPKVEGDFAPLYSYKTGNCGMISNAWPVPFEGGPSGNNTTMRSLGNAKVTTDIVMKGCTVRMNQIIDPGPGAGMSEIAGDVTIHNENQLEGVVSVTVFDPTGQPACSGTYDAEFTKPAPTAGGAANQSAVSGGAAQ